MAAIPVTDSTISGKYLADLVQKEYGLKNVECRIFRTGINHSYIIKSEGKKYVIRVYSFGWRTKTEILEEVKLLNLLQDHNISVSYPIVRLTKEYLLNLEAPEGLRYGVLFSFAEGEKIRSFSVDTAHNIGKLMAHFHQVTQCISLDRIHYNSESLVSSSYQKALVHFEASNQDMQFIMKAEERIKKEFEQIDVTQLRTGIVHLDIWYDNMHIKNESEMTIFDFDFCGNGWLLHDIAYFLMQTYHYEPDKELYNEKREAFFKGYESVSPIHAEEKVLLPYSGLAIWIFYLGVQSERFDNWSNVFLSENFLTRFMGMAKDWLKFNEVEI